MFYVDTSAAVKLVIAERGSKALRDWIAPRDDRLASSDLIRTELIRATRRTAPERMSQARAVLDSLVLLRLTTALFETAALLEPGVLRSLDALHLAAALELGDALEGFVTYDERLVEACRTLGIGVVSPS